MPLSPTFVSKWIDNDGVGPDSRFLFCRNETAPTTIFSPENLQSVRILPIKNFGTTANLADEME